MLGGKGQFSSCAGTVMTTWRSRVDHLFPNAELNDMTIDTGPNETGFLLSVFPDD